MSRRALSLLAALALGGATLATACQSTRDGEDDAVEGALVTRTAASLFAPGNRFAGWGGEHDRYLDEVQPLLGKRCVTCHGCSSSPCQLKLTSFEGVKRGSNPHGFFSTQGPPTRLKDGRTEAEWTAKGFYSVTTGGDQSIMANLVAHGTQHNGPGFDLAPAYSIYAQRAELLAFACVDQPGELDERLAQKGTGMPLGLPALATDEANVLLTWLKDGAPGPTAANQKTLEQPRDAAKVAEWEAFFNQDDARWQLAMEYVYEHVFFGKFHFDDSVKGRGDFFELVRARSKTGPIDELVTEAPGDDPGGPYFWRLKKYTPLVSAKDHIVFHADAKLMARWKTLFGGDWTVPAAGAGPARSRAGKNPFEFFEPIPGAVRYQFMLENAHALIDAMVKGDVCTGTQATSAIRDRFFTMFLKPSSDPSAKDPKLGRPDYAHLDPTSPSPARDASLESLFEGALRRDKPQGLAESDIWDGDKKDANAWVTVLRHDTNSSAHKGPAGQLADTVWVLDYANFERLYYTLVALYKPWGPMGQKASAWQTMAQVRSHSEDLFLMLVPPEQRDEVRKAFTPGFSMPAATPMRGEGYPTAVRDLDAARPVAHLVSRLRAYFGPAIATADALEADPMAPAAAAPATVASSADADRALAALAASSTKLAAVLPEVTWLTVDTGREKLRYTLVANRIFGSSRRTVDAESVHRPELDSVAVIRGRKGGFPQLFLRVPLGELGAFVTAATGTSDAERAALRGRYEVVRNTPAFWATLDEEHAAALASDPLESGVIDTSAYLWPSELQRGR